MLNALARGDSGLRASIGARRPGRRRLRLRAPSRTEAGPAHGTRGRGPAVPLSLQPWAQGIMASRPPTPGRWQRRGPDGWSALGVWGPSAFQAPCPWPLLPGTSVTSALRTSRCSHRGGGSLCSAKPLKPPSASTAPERRQLRRERPASTCVREAPMDHRGAAWLGLAPALGPSRLLLPGCPCTWVRRGQFGLRHWPQADNTRAVASSVPRRGGTGPSPANAPQPPSVGSLSCLGTPSRGTPPRPRSPGARASRAPARTARLWPGRLYIRRVGSARSSDLPAHRPGAGRAGGGAWTGPGSRGHVGGVQAAGSYCMLPLPPTLHSACPPG